MPQTAIARMTAPCRLLVFGLVGVALCCFGALPLAAAAPAEPGPAASVGSGSAPSASEPAQNSAPNFVIIVADDMGFSDAGCYGGEIATPHLDQLAAEGLRFTQMYSTARCWPSRTCILTGYYAQQVRMDPPKGRLPAWARLLPHYLKPLGYRSYHSGKWHVPGAPKPVHDGGFDHSYCLEDHNRFFSPRHALLDDQPLAPVPEGTDFYVTTAIAEYAIGFLKEHARDHATKPFFLYLAFTSPHFPLHARAEDIARYRDRYLAGWDAIRQQRHHRMRRMGLVRCALSDLEPQTIPAWNLAEEELQRRIGPGEVGRAVPWASLSQQQQQFQALKMAIHAAMIDRMDQEIDRVLQQLRAMRAWGNTLVLFVSDNGASAEQIIRGDGHDPDAPPGSAKTFLCLGPGWSTAANTPFRLHKSWVHEGGIASPMILSWPARIPPAQRGQLRHTPCHFIDILPTVLELAGARIPGAGSVAEPMPHPSRVATLPTVQAAGEPAQDGEKTPAAPPLPGRSLVPTLEHDAAIQRDFLYFHHLNHRAIRVGDWKLVSAGTKEKPGPWELYDLASDRCERNDLAARQPDQVQQLADLWQQCEDQFRQQAGPAEPGQSKPPRPGRPTQSAGPAPAAP